MTFTGVLDGLLVFFSILLVACVLGITAAIR